MVEYGILLKSVVRLGQGMKARKHRNIKANRRPIRKSTTRVTVDFPKSVHRSLKARAALAGISLQQYIRNRVLLEEGTISDEDLKPIVNKIIDENEDILRSLADQ